VVDPGFGMCQQEGSWVSSDNERLHFLVANLSSTKYHFAPGASIAAIQFLTLDASIESTEWAADIVSTKDVYAEFYNGDAMERRGLGFFSQLEPLKAAVEELKTLQVKVDTLAQSTNQLIFFGVFLLAVTILAATLAVFLTFIGNAGVMKTLSGVSWAGAVAALAVSAGSAFIVWLLVNTLSRTSARRASSAGTPVSGGASDARASARGRASTEGAGASTPGDASSDAAEASSARNAPTEPGE
jgi:hypothetical protein